MPNELDERSNRPAKKAQPLPREEIEDQEEKARLIAQILELQNTLEGMAGGFLGSCQRAFRSQPAGGQCKRREHEAAFGEPGAGPVHPEPDGVESDLPAHAVEAVLKVNWPPSAILSLSFVALIPMLAAPKCFANTS